tara:strand:+ start:2228 stop:3013 length:786 start_codon:yes stop_codon:yes gene_type:complete
MYENILLDINEKERVAVLTFNRPEALNALNERTLKELDDALDILAKDTVSKVVIVTGSGEKSFVAGADIKEMQGLDKKQGIEFSVRGQNVLNKLERLGKPSIAAINGFALGGGSEVALACSIRIASENAKFGQPEINLGIIPGYGGTQRLPRIVGLGRAIEIMTTGEMISAQTAKEIGLVNAVVPQDQLLEKSMDLARMIASKSAPVIKLILDSVYDGLSVDFQSALDIESDAIGSSFATKDAQEGIQAFIEKRKADFQDC